MFPVGKVTIPEQKVTHPARRGVNRPAKVLCPERKVRPEFWQVTHPVRKVVFPESKVTFPEQKVTLHLRHRERHSGKLKPPVRKVTRHLGNREHHFSFRDHHPALVTLPVARSATVCGEPRLVQLGF